MKIKDSQEIRHTKDCHYETPLPFRSDLWFPENKQWVIQREHWLRKKLVKSYKIQGHYVWLNFLNSIIAKGFSGR